MKKRGAFYPVLWVFCLGFASWAQEANWVWSKGDRTVAWDGEQGKVALQLGQLDLKGEGDLLLLRPQEDGFDYFDVDKELSRGREVAVMERDFLACRVSLGERKGRSFLAVMQANGTETFVAVPFHRIGLPRSVALVGYDLTAGRFMPPLGGSWFLSVPRDGTVSCVVSRVSKVPFFLCSDGILKGTSPSETDWDAGTHILTGSLNVEASERQDLLFFLPSGDRTWRAEEVAVAAQDGSCDTKARILQTDGFLRVRIEPGSSREGELDWYVTFREEKAVKPEPVEVYFSARGTGARRVELTCYAGGQDLLIERNDGYVFFRRGTWTADTMVHPNTTYIYELYPLRWKRLRKPLAAAETKTLELPPIPPLPEVYLSELDPIKAVNGWNGEPRKDKSIEDHPITLRGEVFARGMGVHADSELVYELRPSYKRFVSVIGVDDEKNDAPSGSVTFEVLADETSLFKTGVLTPKDEWVLVNVPIPSGAQRLRLLVGDGGNGIACDHADWANAGFLTE